MIHELNIVSNYPLWVEIIGPSGSGKSTIIQKIVKENSSIKRKIPRRRLYNLFCTLGWLNSKEKYFHGRWPQHQPISQYLQLLSEHESGVLVVDEGPIHKLTVKVVRNEDMRYHWSKYCKWIVNSIVESVPSRILVIKVNTPAEERFDRRKERKYPKDISVVECTTFEDYQRKNERRPSLGTMEDWVLKELRKKMNGRFFYYQIDGGQELSVVSSEIMSFIVDVCGEKSRYAGGAHHE